MNCEVLWKDIVSYKKHRVIKNDKGYFVEYKTTSGDWLEQEDIEIVAECYKQAFIYANDNFNHTNGLLSEFIL